MATRASSYGFRSVTARQASDVIGARCSKPSILGAPVARATLSWRRWPGACIAAASASARFRFSSSNVWPENQRSIPRRSTARPGMCWRRRCVRRRCEAHRPLRPRLGRYPLVTAETSYSSEGTEVPLRIAVVAWGLAGAAACAVMAVLEPNLVEEGFPLHVAQRLLAGQRLYRDIVFFTGPLPFELLALLFRIFGENILVARAAVVVLHGITSAATFDLARRAGAGPLAHLAAALVVVSPALLFPLYSIYFHTTVATSLTLLAVYAAVRAAESIGWACAAGVLAGSVMLSKQTVGATLGVGLLVALWVFASRE